MYNEPHDLTHEFPQYKDAIHALKESDQHFARLFEEYYAINRDIHRAETDIEPTDDAHLEEMKKKRLALKDELFSMLEKAA